MKSKKLAKAIIDVLSGTTDSEINATAGAGVVYVYYDDSYNFTLFEDDKNKWYISEDDMQSLFLNLSLKSNRKSCVQFLSTNGNILLIYSDVATMRNLLAFKRVGDIYELYNMGDNYL